MINFQICQSFFVKKRNTNRPLEHNQERARLGDLQLLVQLLLPDLAVRLEAVQPEVVRLADVVLDEAERAGPLFDPGSVRRRLRQVQLDHGRALGLISVVDQSRPAKDAWKYEEREKKNKEETVNCVVGRGG